MRLTIKGEYPADWKEIASRVKAEAANRCVRCGHPDGDKLVRNFDIEIHGEGGNFPDDVLRAIGEPTRIKKLKPCDKQCRHPEDGKLRQLTVHHLDGDKSNCRWWNLLALCQKCHLEIQARVVPERPFLWEHSEWFKPYAAGFYAHWYGKHDVSRGVVELDLDLFLEMGQPWLYTETKRCLP